MLEKNIPNTVKYCKRLCQEGSFFCGESMILTKPEMH